MSAIADGVDFFLHIFSAESASKPKVSKSELYAGTGGIYLLCSFLWVFIWKFHTTRSFSSILTCASMAQLLGFLLLTIKVRATKSVAGISSKTLEMYLIFFVCRLGVTLFTGGYNPIDKSGRCAYQCLDALSFLVVLQLLYCVHITHKKTYQQEHDTMELFPLIPPCLVAAFFIHVDYSSSEHYSEFFDVLWALSAYVDMLAMLPQLWMLTKIGGQVEGMTSNFVAAMTARSALALTFWVKVYHDMFYSTRTEISGLVLTGTFAVQLLLAADFMFYYARARIWGSKVVLPQKPAVDI
jgi:ER lumen protein retaining receptor